MFQDPCVGTLELATKCVQMNAEILIVSSISESWGSSNLGYGGCGVTNGVDGLGSSEGGSGVTIATINWGSDSSWCSVSESWGSVGSNVSSVCNWSCYLGNSGSICNSGSGIGNSGSSVGNWCSNLSNNWGRVVDGLGVV